MADHQSPEIVRLPLEELCLRIKACGLGDIHDFLSQALDAPGAKAIDNAIYSLQEVNLPILHTTLFVFFGPLPSIQRNTDTYVL
jgi:hypothetical protein